MRSNPTRKLWLTGAVCVTAAVFLSVVVSTKKDSTLQTLSPPTDLDSHPIYSQYEFVRDGKAINIGIQPFYFPTGLITETMRRDNILRGQLAELGMELRFHSFLKGDDVNFFLMRGDLDIGIVGDMPAINAAEESDIIIPVLIQHGFTSIVANHSMTMEQLRGKRIGYAFGSNAHYTLLNAMSSAELGESDVTLIPMEISDMIGALDSGAVDAFSGWEPTVALALKKIRECGVVRRNVSTGYMYFSRSFADAHPQAMRYIIAAEIRAIAWLQRSSDNLIAAKHQNEQAEYKLKEHSNGLSELETMELAKSDILGMTLNPSIPRSLLEENEPIHKECNFLCKLKNNDPETNWEKVRNSFDLQITGQILAQQGLYRVSEFDYQTDGDTGGN